MGTIKDFGEDAQIEVMTTVLVNGQEIFTANSYDIDTAIGELGRVERHNLIAKELISQYEDLPEDTEL